mgnify:CR=1 FL=1|jgi:hypothetical protein
MLEDIYNDAYFSIYYEYDIKLGYLIYDIL